jgi:hypothetical protein
VPGDAKECHQRGLECMNFAEQAKTVEGRKAFLKLADSWFKLAVEIEAVKALVNTFGAPKNDEDDEESRHMGVRSISF